MQDFRLDHFRQNVAQQALVPLEGLHVAHLAAKEGIRNGWPLLHPNRNAHVLFGALGRGHAEEDFDLLSDDDFGLAHVATEV